MRNIFTFLLLVFLQNAFCRNTTNQIVNNNDELVQNLSKDTDFIKYYKYTYAYFLSKSFAIEANKNGNVLTIEEQLAFEDLVKNRANTYQKVLVKFPELNNISIIEKKDVLIKSVAMVAELTSREIIACLISGIGILGTCNKDTYSIIQRSSMMACMYFASRADVALVVGTDGTATPELLTLVGPEIEFCSKFSIIVAGAPCAGTAVSNMVTCFVAQSKD